MPAKQKKNAPKTARKKLFLHTFYLVQPFVQFFALIAVMIALTRCSPLASSTDRITSGLIPAAGGQGSEQAAAAAEEEEIRASLKEVNSAQLEVISESQLRDLTEKTPHVDEPVKELDVKGIFPVIGHKKKNRKVMLIPLTNEAHSALFRDGQVRIALAERLKGQTNEKALKLLLQNLQTSLEHNELGAAAFLVVPDATMQRVNGAYSELDQPLKISLGIPSEDRAYLEITRQSGEASRAGDNAMLLDSARDEALQLAILLE